MSTPDLSAASDDELVDELLGRGVLRTDSSTHVPRWVDEGPCPPDCPEHAGGLVGVTDRHRRLVLHPARCFTGWLPRDPHAPRHTYRA